MGKKKAQRVGKKALPASPWLRILADNIRRLRLEKRWTQQHLARKAGVSQKTVSRMEDGESNTRAENHAFVAIALGTNMIELVREKVQTAARRAGP